MVEQQARLNSWVPNYSEDTHFPLENIPFGVYINPSSGKHECSTRIGDFVVDLAALERLGLFDGPLFGALADKDIFDQRYLNKFMALGRDYWREARATI